MNKKQTLMLWRIIAAFVLTVALQFVPISGWTRLAAFVVVYLIVGYDILRKAWMGMRNGRMFDENFLMSVATLGAFALAVYSGSGDYNEAIAVMLFYQVGELFQSYAVGKSRKSISQLMDIRPDYANIETGGTIERVDPDDVEVGTTIIVNPGEKIPIDGTVAKGSSSLNTSALTGESVPRDVAEGDEVVSGCINLSSVLHITTTKPFDESTVSKILELLEDSAANKSKSEAFISRFARVYTPFVCYSALALALIPTLLLTLFANHSFIEALSVWGYRALTFLVISCPCALVVSIPLSFFAGIGGASKAGILVKGSNILETLSKVKTIVFDKTGTLTQGLFTVNATHHSGFDEDNLRCSCHYCSHHHPTEGDMRLLELAAHAECASSHPISQSLQKAYGKPIDRSRVDNIQEIGGKGIIASVDNHQIAVGNERLMQSVGAAARHCKSIGTIVHLAIDNVYAGHIVISDVVKPTAKQAIEELHKAGISQTVMLTGDLKPVADDIGNKLGVDVIYSELLPDGKVKQLEQIINNQPKEQLVAFVGDGINDAPAICRADVGIAMGALGSDAAIEAADIVLMDDDPLKIAKAVEISRRTLNIVWQNIVFALGVKGACLVLGAFGLANMWLAVFADVGVMIIAILNAIRAMRN